MKRLRRLTPSPAMVVACIALTVALGGTSFAAIKLPRNSVGTKQLKKNAVTSPKVKNNAITGADVNEATLVGFVRPGSAEPWREIGAPGRPAFQNGWVNESAATQTTAAFYKDPLAVVHLKGIVTAGTGTVFTLPAGYRPAKAGCWATWRNGAIAYVCFYPTGNITQGGGAGTGAMLLDGLTFRVGS